MYQFQYSREPYKKHLRKARDINHSRSDEGCARHGIDLIAMTYGSATIYSKFPAQQELFQIGDRLLGLRLNRWYGRIHRKLTHEELAVALSMSEVRVSALGVFRVSIDDVTLQLNHDASRKVLLVLCLSENNSYSREALAGMLWPDTTRKKSLANLRQTIFMLKKSFREAIGGDGPIETDQKTLSLSNCNIVTDVGEMADRLSQEDAALFDSKSVDAFAPEIKTGSDLYLEWLNAYETQFQEKLKATLESNIEEIEEPNVQLRRAKLLASLDPSNELACRTKMKLYYGNGQKADALRCYSELWNKLGELFDVKPSTATQDLAVAIKMDDVKTSIREQWSDRLNADSPLTDSAGLEISVPQETLSESSYHLGDELPPGTGALTWSGLRPIVAVIPPILHTIGEADDPIGEIIADEIIAGLSKCEDLQVISRLSTTQYRAKPISLEEIALNLGAAYVVSGSYRSSGSVTRVTIELVEVRSKSVLWSERMAIDVEKLFMGSDELISLTISETSRIIIGNELQRALTMEAHTLESYTLQIAAIRLMHRASRSDFERAKGLWQALTIRVHHLAIPHAQLAKWHLLGFTRGWNTNGKQVAESALECTSKALDNDSHCSLALTVDGCIRTQILRDLDAGEEMYRNALNVNPNEPLAWLFLGTLNAFKGNGTDAMAETDQAMRLSPIDPLRYFYESLAATAALSANEFDRAVELANNSISLNKTHSSTYRALAIAQVNLGKDAEARQTTEVLLKLDPTLTVRSFLARSPSADFEIGRSWAKALETAGVPK